MWIVQLLNGIAFGFILFLLGSGLSLILGFMGVLNLAHGALYMVGAYVGVTVAGEGVNFWIAALAGGFAAGVVGLGIERIFLRFLYKQMNEQVLLTVGFIYILTNAIQWIWGPWPKIGAPPPLLSGSVNIGEFSLPVYRLAIIVVGLLIAGALYWLQEKTRIGAIIRAGMDDKEMTVGLGINYDLVASAVFFSGVFIAGFAGFMGAPILGAYLGAGWDVLMLATIVIVVGGMGSMQGALLGGVIIGVIDNFGKALFPDFAMFTIYLVLVLILIFKPTGLLGRKET